MVYSCSTYATCEALLQVQSRGHEDFVLNMKKEEMKQSLQETLGRDLSDVEVKDIHSAFSLMHSLTAGKKLPRLFQMQATLELLSGKNISVRAGTGSGKSIAMGLAMLLRPQWIFVTVAPLMALQGQHVETFRRLSISSVAINNETPASQRVQIKKDIKRGLYRHIIISPEQCARSAPESPMFTEILEDKAFVSRIKCLIFDEAHFIVTSGQPDKEGNIFRYEYSKGYEIRLRLTAGTPCALYSATMPPRIRDQIFRSLRLPSDPSQTSLITLTTNRPNLTFAVKKLPGPLSRMSNLDFLVPDSYHPPMTRLKKTIIFVTNTQQALDIEDFLRSRIGSPTVVQRIHASLSARFKSQIVEDFCNPSGRISILVATTVISNGFDPSDVEIVVLYGAPTTMLDFEQMAGRGGRDGRTNCLVLLLAEPWLYISGEEEIKNPNGSLCVKAGRTEKAVFDYVQCQQCRREFLALMNEDSSDNALNFTGPYCCDSPNHMVTQAQDFNFSCWIPGPCEYNNVSGVSSSEVTGSRVRTNYRPLSERRELTGILEDWRLKVYKEEPCNSLFPIDDILGSQHIVALSRLLPDSLAHSSLAHLTDFLGQSQEWNTLFAAQVFKIITDYNISWPLKIRRQKKEVEWTANMHTFSSRPPRSQALSQTPTQGTSGTRTRAGIDSRVSVDKRQNPGTPYSSPSKPASKRLKRVPLAERIQN